ncbi:uncharacterized protein LOC131613937 [Vicia villosa]|uniref:uncharacterized protein LOC131613937 n=1 Tax=Vicia villosa TaxID=3911 RepID=UPI00273B8C0A|nr:uncharacterized protein LOC131613937 [Vicia villosa]
MTLPPGYVKVNIEVAIVPNASLPISVDGGDVSLVGHAIGTILPWPMKLLEFAAECKKIPDQSQIKGKNIQHTVEYSVSSPNKSNKRFKIEESPRVGGSTGLAILPFLDIYLYDKFISPNGLINKFSFISPHVSREDNLGYAIAKILLKDEEFKDKMILAPCNLGKHWVLLVINPDTEVIYYMDPLNGELTKHQNLKIKFEK